MVDIRSEGEKSFSGIVNDVTSRFNGFEIESRERYENDPNVLNIRLFQKSRNKEVLGYAEMKI